MTCPDDDTIVNLLEGRLPDDARTSVLGHLDTCEGCRRLIADAGALGDDSVSGSSSSGSGSGSSDGGPERWIASFLGRGALIGRYVVSHVLGAGAMGVVYAAHDPQLGRDVAIKLLRRGAAGGLTDEQSREAMLREARTLAQLAHPNVIAVHDADLHDGRVFIVMELVDGRTLRKWLSLAPRGWREIRDVFVQAGRGLEAAHAAGVIHRDVKPDNLLVGRDGRVRVTDFGLARWSGPLPTPARMAVAALRSSTQMVGTPAYMSPEQLAGRPIDARSDLFGFCVALHEALYGERPFDGWRLAAAAGDSAPPPPVVAAPRAGMPTRARRALERGLRGDRDARPPSMSALLADLDHHPRITGPRIAAAAVALGAVGAAVFAPRGGAGSPASRPCSGADAAWGTLWNPTQRAAVREAFLHTRKPIAAAAFAQTDAAVEDYRHRWLDLHTGACLAHARGEQSSTMLDRRMACLTVRRREIGEAIASLASNVAFQDWLLADAAGMIRRQRPLVDCADARGDDRASTLIRPVRAPVAQLDRDGRLEVFAIGGGGNVWRIAETDTRDPEAPIWGMWASLGARIDARTLAADHDQDGSLGLIALDATGALDGIWQPGGTWERSDWARISEVGFTQLSIVNDGAGRHQLFGIEHGNLFHLAQVAPNSGWAPWQHVRDGVDQVVAIHDEGPDGGRVHVFMVIGGRVWHAWQDGDGWSEAQPLGDRAIRQIDAVVNADGRLELVGVDPSNRAYHAWVKARGADATRADAWSAWEPLGTPEAIATIRAVRNSGDGHVEAFGITPTGGIIHLWQARHELDWNGWWETLPVNPEMRGVTDLALVLDATGRLYTFAAADSGALWMTWQSAAGPLHGWLVL